MSKTKCFCCELDVIAGNEIVYTGEDKTITEMVFCSMECLEQKTELKRCYFCGQIRNSKKDMIAYSKEPLATGKWIYFCCEECAVSYLNCSEKTEPEKIISINVRHSKDKFTYDELTTLLTLVQVEIIGSSNLLVFTEQGSVTYNAITQRRDGLVIIRDKLTNKIISFNFVAA